MQGLKLGILIGTRPGIVKMSVVYHAVREAGFNSLLIHSGQHYSISMDKQIMTDVELPQPDFRFLRPKDCKTHGTQTAFMLRNIEEALIDSQPDFLFVCGDANTNLAGALAARKLQIPVGHVEAGLRSYDWRMPEEHNRRIIDHISELLFAPSDTAIGHLHQESVMGNIHCVGNTVVDAALRFSPEKAFPSGRALLTIHREENVDDPSCLRHLLNELGSIIHYSDMKVDFLLHPRTRKRFDDYDLWGDVHPSIRLLEPVGYRDMLRLVSNAEFVLTDSGGLQEEACILQTPCYTLRKSTERPETVQCGANVVLGIENPAFEFRKNFPRTYTNWMNPYGEGNAAERIVKLSIEWLERENSR